MVFCTAVSKKAGFSPAGKILYQSHCPSLFPLTFFFHYGSTCKSQAPGAISLSLSCLSCPTGSWNQQKSDLSLQLAHAQWLFNPSPTEVPYPYSLIAREMCIPSFILTMCFLNPGVGVLALDVCFDTIMGLTSFWHTTRRTTPIRKQGGGSKAKEALPQLHLLSCGWEGQGPGSVLQKAWKDPCRWKPLGDCGPHSLPSLSVVLVSISYIPFSLQRFCVSALSLGTVSDHCSYLVFVKWMNECH